MSVKPRLRPNIKVDTTPHHTTPQEPIVVGQATGGRNSEARLIDCFAANDCYGEKTDAVPPPIPSSLLLREGHWHLNCKIGTSERLSLTCSGVDCEIDVSIGAVTVVCGLGLSSLEVVMLVVMLMVVAFGVGGDGGYCSCKPTTVLYCFAVVLHWFAMVVVVVDCGGCGDGFDDRGGLADFVTNNWTRD
ncbi:Hypothetical predicted protein [Olea europaea subsp. europaea]|uniref:Uncharacterized protein n=1 Tax=Olea europaea subsp. europaea TaxID=158383 RepID=A0A8S0SI23_OLEEU|nr:Hypothetical predicted protein [Olea europaea subsp. europaea]